MILRFTIPIPPGLLAINRKYEPQSRSREGKRWTEIGIRKEWAAAFDEAVMHVRQAVVANRWRARERHVEVTIVSHWPTNDGDCDATCKAVLDILQAANVVVNDRLCRPVHLDDTHEVFRPGEISVVVEDRESVG